MRRTRHLAGTFGAVHFACHGIVDTQEPMLSCLALGPSEEDDGFLRALDVFRWKVPAGLVVRSACEAARGEVVRGEGVVGLARAFMHAGLPCRLCSLWKVDDEATAASMTRFCVLGTRRDRSEGLPAVRALREAQAWVPVARSPSLATLRWQTPSVS